ncbi:MAG: GIY-YIG nuclease family protein [Patescibacteria group bacterium]
MYYVYILLSKKSKKLYKGLTSDIKKRLSEHNKGKVDSTKNGKP